MSDKKNKFDFETEEKRREYLDQIIGFFKTEHDLELGIIAAEKILNFFLETLGNEIYRKGITDSKKILKQAFDNLEVDIDALL